MEKITIKVFFIIAAAVVVGTILYKAIAKYLPTSMQ